MTTCAIIFTDSMSLLPKVESGMGSLNWNVSMADSHFSKLYKVNDPADRLVGKATITRGLHLWRSEVLRSLRHYQWAHSQGYHTIDHPEERCGKTWQSSMKGWERAIINQMNAGLFQGQCCRNLWQAGRSMYVLFHAHIYHLELNWTERRMKNKYKNKWKR